MKDLVIEGEVLEALRMPPSELLIELAVYLYDKERLSMGQAKKLAGLTQLEFQHALAKREVCIKYDVEDFEEDMRTLDKLRKG